MFRPICLGLFALHLWHGFDQSTFRCRQLRGPLTSMKLLPIFLLIFISLRGLANGQNHAADLPTDQLLSQAGPTFRLTNDELKAPVSFIAYGDMRFTDPTNTKATNPAVRKWLVQKIAEEAPAAIFLNGDVPLSGEMLNDYAVFHTETASWRLAQIRVYPTLGNHEFHGPNPQQCLENWWNTFPEFRNRRWYSVQLGSHIYAINLDSDAKLLPGTDQTRWVSQQLEHLPRSVDYVLISLHHPPVADIQTHLEVDHNPRPNEIALRDLLSSLAPRLHARIIVSAGHIHNYERNQKDDVVYLVSGGGGAKPYFVERTRRSVSKLAVSQLSLHQVCPGAAAPEGHDVPGCQSGTDSADPGDKAKLSLLRLFGEES
jgi:acid phosphatase type 7